MEFFTSTIGGVHYCLITTDKDRKKLAKALCQKLSTIPALDDGLCGKVVQLKHSETNRLLIVVYIDVGSHSSYTSVISTIVHESVHVNQFVNEYINESNPSIEYEAYSVESIFNSLFCKMLKRGDLDGFEK